MEDQGTENRISMAQVNERRILAGKKVQVPKGANLFREITQRFNNDATVKSSPRCARRAALVAAGRSGSENRIIIPIVLNTS